MATNEQKADLRMHLQHLRDYSDFYDAGKVTHALSMAVTIRVLLHDGRGQSKSLLTQMGAPEIELLSTVPEPPNIPGLPPPMLIQGGLSGLQMRGGVGKHVPNLGRFPGCAHFRKRPQWWAQSIYSGTVNLTRSALVMTAADRKAAHSDPRGLTADYATLKDGVIEIVTLNADGKVVATEKIKDADLADLRQIAYEVLNSPSLISLST